MLNIYSVIISFDTVEHNSLFGVGGYARLSFSVNEETKNVVIEAFQSGNSIIPINVDANTVRYVNMKNVLYIDVKEQKEETDE